MRPSASAVLRLITSSNNCGRNIGSEIRWVNLVKENLFPLTSRRDSNRRPTALQAVTLRHPPTYGFTPSIAMSRNLAYCSPFLWAACHSGLFHHFCSWSMFSN